MDCEGKHLFTVAPHGSVDKLPYVTMGSGSLAAMSIMETEWKENMTVTTPKKNEKFKKKKRIWKFSEAERNNRDSNRRPSK